eukprot:s1471_g3.t1
MGCSRGSCEMSLLRFAVILASVACGASQGTVSSECQEKPHLEDFSKPITEVLYEHPGEDAWCIMSDLEAPGFRMACAMARKHKRIRSFAAYENRRISWEGRSDPVGEGEGFSLETQKKVVLPGGSSLMVRDYIDIWCVVNGYYNVSRAPALDDYEYLTHVSANLCFLSKQRVPDYNSLSLNDLLLHYLPHVNYINKKLMSEKPVVHLNQTDVDLMYRWAGVQCRMDNDHGGNCDVGYCAYRGCLDADGMTVKHTDKGECPPDPSRPWRKLIVVCAKLPFTLIWNEDKGVIRLERDEFEADFAEILAAEISEGKVQASVRVRPDEVYLVGTPVVRRAGDRSLITVCDEGLQQQLVSFLQTACDVVTLPVFPPPFRDRFADQVIFPLFHYTPPSVETGIGLSDWEGYKLVNETYRDAVLQIYSRGDLVLINDYPLMLLPKALRKERPDISIGFYIHCVFPSSEVYRILPQREELLRGVLSSNVIGFHNFQYVRHFLTAATRILGCECTANGIEACEDAGGTSTKVIAVPLGIQLEPYTKIFNREETKQRIRDLERTFAGKTILMAVDRLEEKEGIPHKIMAFHKFLQKSPSWAERVVFVQLVNQAKAEDGDDEKVREERQLLQQAKL